MTTSCVWPTRTSHECDTVRRTHRVRQSFTTPRALFDGAPADERCGGLAAVDRALRAYAVVQASGHVLVDQRMNYVVYDTRLNEVTATSANFSFLLRRAR